MFHWIKRDALAGRPRHDMIIAVSYPFVLALIGVVALLIVSLLGSLKGPPEHPLVQPARLPAAGGRIQ